MMAGGLWVIADPTGTVERSADGPTRPSLGTLAVGSARARPAAPERTLAGSMRHGLRSDDRSAVVLPGVRRRRLVPRAALGSTRRLRAAALRIAASELAQIGCG